MVLRGINFGKILVASGAQGFFGEGYPFHKYAKLLGMTFEGVTFVSKTTTIKERPGNMPLDRGDRITPLEFRPKCIRANFWEKAALNAVGLSGPGANWLFTQGRWQERLRPFFVSFMAIGETLDERLLETTDFCSLTRGYHDQFETKFGMELNVACPNVDQKAVHHDPDGAVLVDGIHKQLDILGEIGIPILVKINALLSPHIAAQIVKHPACDGLTNSNTIPWSDIPESINKRKIFRSHISPLAAFGGGGLSGAPVLPLVEQWLKEFRQLDPHTPVNAGGGICGPDDATRLLAAGATSVFLGSMAFLRPWMMRPTIQAVNDYFDWDKE